MSRTNHLFVSLMPYLKDKGGHDCIYHQCLQKAIETCNIQFLGFTSLDATKTPWKKWFREAGTSLHLLKRLVRRLRDFAQIFHATRSGQGRIFFIDAFSRIDLIVFCIAIFIYSKPVDSFWIFFRYPLPGAKFHTYRTFCTLLQKKLRQRFVALTDSEKIVATFEGLSPKLTVWPIPHTRHLDLKKKPLPFEKILCWWPGPPRQEKGWEDIRKLTHIKHPSSKRFTLVAAHSSKLVAGSNDLRVELIPDPLSNEEFAQKLAECHVVFLPYDKDAYYARTSGIFVEAVVAHKIPFVKAGSWLADELKRFDLEELILDWDREDFFSEVSTILENENMLKKLVLMQQAYAKFHSMEEFQNQIHTLLGSRDYDV